MASILYRNLMGLFQKQAKITVDNADGTQTVYGGGTSSNVAPRKGVITSTDANGITTRHERVNGKMVPVARYREGVASVGNDASFSNASPLGAGDPYASSNYASNPATQAVMNPNSANEQLAAIKPQQVNGRGRITVTRPDGSTADYASSGNGRMHVATETAAPPVDPSVQQARERRRQIEEEFGRMDSAKQRYYSDAFRKAKAKGIDLNTVEGMNKAWEAAGRGYTNRSIGSSVRTVLSNGSNASDTSNYLSDRNSSLVNSGSPAQRQNRIDAVNKLNSMGNGALAKLVRQEAEAMRLAGSQTRPVDELIMDPAIQRAAVNKYINDYVQGRYGSY